ncbi:EamA family transporter [Actinomyces gaoshouyii]|uniref:Multidrug DMT transporter permease n=1 Tax=Actinomyces gaoshouyii TaxID=1960083 RepID=A0A8H9HCZ4_9ACTO|nr:EamA family transporter [Actinomyces gaoshouyii]GGO97346.1 multidrug DMT transporter permease [Actinomyces gaoshouyii]
MWIVFACGSALFAGLTAVLAKAGTRQIDSTLATALRTPAVLAAAVAMVLLRGSQAQIASIDAAALGWLVASGLATGASWLCYFKALQLGEASRVAPIDKLSTVLTVLLAVVLLGEPLTALGGAGVVLMVVGTLLMLERADALTLCAGRPGSRGWLVYALGSAVFAALTAILGKLGIVGVESNLGTAIRTAVVLVMAWAMVAVSGRRRPLRSLPRQELALVLVSGLTTGASWLCFYRALQDGPASVIVPIDKLSILVTVVFSILILRERLSGRYLAGLVLLTIGTLAMAL